MFHDDEIDHDDEAALRLEVMARHIRNLYYHYRRLWFLRNGYSEEQAPVKRIDPRWDGGRDSYNRMFKAIWPSIATFYLEHDLNPDLAIQAVFETASGGDPPLPNMLKSSRMLANYETYKQRSFGMISAKIRVQLEEAEREIILEQLLDSDEVTACRNVICAPHGYSPLVRYCLAHSAGQRDLANSWREAAVMEYLGFESQYDAALGSHLPEDFREQARTLRHRLLAVGSR